MLVATGKAQISRTTACPRLHLLLKTVHCRKIAGTPNMAMRKRTAVVLAVVMLVCFSAVLGVAASAPSASSIKAQAKVGLCYACFYRFCVPIDFPQSC